jgi:prevent-host-death family protein
MTDVSARELQDHTDEVLRRVEAGERLRIVVDGRPVAELVALGRSAWLPGAVAERILRDAPCDAALLTDLRPIRQDVESG